MQKDIDYAMAAVQPSVKKAILVFNGKSKCTINVKKLIGNNSCNAMHCGAVLSSIAIIVFFLFSFYSNQIHKCHKYVMLIVTPFNPVSYSTSISTVISAYPAYHRNIKFVTMKHIRQIFVSNQKRRIIFRSFKFFSVLADKVTVCTVSFIWHKAWKIKWYYITIKKNVMLCRKFYIVQIYKINNFAIFNVSWKWYKNTCIKIDFVVSAFRLIIHCIVIHRFIICLICLRKVQHNFQDLVFGINA